MTRLTPLALIVAGVLGLAVLAVCHPPAPVFPAAVSVSPDPLSCPRSVPR